MWECGVSVSVCEVGRGELKELKDEQSAAETFTGTWGWISVLAAVYIWLLGWGQGEVRASQGPVEGHAQGSAEGGFRVAVGRRW